jgi:phosphoribosyl 1,2-cyclic phosphodiesterase
VTVTFWGVRGSIPTPLTPKQLRSRVAAVVQRVTADDLTSQEARELFLARLPPYLFGSVGGNTTCIEIRDANGGLIIIDAGSGIRELGVDLANRGDSGTHFPILITHFHWDHLQGLPFFRHAYVSGNQVTFYSPVRGFADNLRHQMQPPFFPVDMSVMNAQLEFVELSDSSLQIGDVEITWRKMKHPGGSYAYRFAEKGRNLVFATDAEITETDFEKNADNTRFFSDTDLLILDAQYTLGEAIEKYGWGHTSPSMAVDFAGAWRAKKLALFHHEPLYEDKKIYRLLRTAHWYKHHLESAQPEVLLAQEGMVLEV